MVLNSLYIITRCAGEKRKAFELRLAIHEADWGTFFYKKAEDLPGFYVHLWHEATGTDAKPIAYVNVAR